MESPLGFGISRKTSPDGNNICRTWISNFNSRLHLGSFPDSLDAAAERGAPFSSPRGRCLTARYAGGLFKGGAELDAGEGAELGVCTGKVPGYATPTRGIQLRRGYPGSGSDG